jgi:hypothetical protein
MNIEEAKQVLKDAGFFTDNLWHVDDVKSKFKCTNDQAQDILNTALTGMIGEIHEAIEEAGEIEGFK